MSNTSMSWRMRPPLLSSRVETRSPNHLRRRKDIGGLGVFAAGGVRSEGAVMGYL